ncbi:MULTISPECIES: MarR family winged helix-turn-helix transcriptional regulator [Anaerotruncus]|jgi:DNA-binding MarR family transcriptional regulator|uniref:MarR family winged helix-turn-helix transcriptional regulator n=1 Tax=Anaerotruncus TaxID=244127 RepID=UPI000832D335|nr:MULTISPECIES: MarR family transcriptional regulator [Anaerotruncus]RGX56326.1 MarR family transcriptional regulator [Anaerotruncus sp. AF02-27]
MITTKLIVEDIVKIIPEFEYQFGRPMKLITQKELTNYQSKVLTVLQVVSEISMSELADRLVMSKPQLTANVDVLVRLGLVERISDPNDRRKIIIRMAEKGVQYIDKTKQSMGKFYDLYYNNLTEEERLKLYLAIEDLLVLLEKLNPLSHGITLEQLKDAPAE